MHGITLDGLSEAELIELHDQIVDRLHFLHQQRTTHALLELAIGERVMFEDNSGQTQEGIVIRRNRKTGDSACRQRPSMECFSTAAAERKPG